MDTFSIVKTIHFVVVSVFLVIYLVKTILLLANKTEQLESFTGFSTILEITLSFVILVTGAMLIIQSPNINYFQLAKYGAFLISIPFAIIGFKKSKKILALLSLIFLIITFGLAEVAQKHAFIVGVKEAPGSAEYGAALYKKGCERCHGEDGTRAFLGATDLSESALSPEAKLEIIKKGRGKMPAFDYISDAEAKALVFYLETTISTKHNL